MEIGFFYNELTNTFNGLITNGSSSSNGLNVGIRNTEYLYALTPSGYLNLATKMRANQLIHVFLTYDGRIAKLYNNLSNDVVTLSVPNLNYNPSLKTRIGNMYTGGYGPLNGKILFGRIYEKALSEQEIQRNYQMEKERWDI